MIAELRPIARPCEADHCVRIASVTLYNCSGQAVGDFCAECSVLALEEQLGEDLEREVRIRTRALADRLQRPARTAEQEAKDDQMRKVVGAVGRGACSTR